MSDAQAEDILEIRLRQLARMEAIRIEQELSQLRGEQDKLQELLANPASLKRLMAREIEADAKTFADARRTLIQADQKTVLEVRVVDEPVTVVVSAKGWVRTRGGHGHDPASFSFKAGDGLHGTFECRSIDPLIVLGSNGRVYSVPVSSLPGGRGDGQPITTLIELESGTQPQFYWAGAASTTLLLSGSGGYGLLAQLEHMISRNKAGKAFFTLPEGETLCTPSLVSSPNTDAATHVCATTVEGRILTFELSELKLSPKGGRGLQLTALEEGDALAGAAAYISRIQLCGVGRGQKEREEALEIRSLNNARAPRGRKGKPTNLGFKVKTVSRLV